MKKILIIGGTPFARNRGVAALINGCVRSIRMNFNNPKISVVHSFVESYYPKATTRMEDVNIIMDDEERPIKVLKLGFIRLFIATLWRFLSFFHIKADFLLNEKLLAEYKQTDVVANISFGDIFAYRKNNFYINFLFFILSYQSLLAILLGKPLVFVPQSIGPFESRFSKFGAKFILNNSKVIMVRESLSKTYLLNMKIVTPIHVIPDLSFLLIPASEDRTSEILSIEKVEMGHPLIGIAIRENMITDLDVIAEVSNYLIEKMNAKIIFVPHTSISQADVTCCDPIFLAKEVSKKIKVKDNVFVIEDEYTVGELRGIIGKCDVFFGGFMHANLSAIAMCVPVIALSYSHKTEGIMSMVGLEDYVLHFGSLTSTELIAKIEEAWSNLDVLKENLEKTVPLLQKKTMTVGDLIKKSIE